MTMLRQAQRLGLVGEDPAVPAFLASHLRLAEGKRRLAGTRGEGEAAAVAAEFAANPALLPEDRVSIETLARQRGAVERHRRQADLRARESEDLAAFAAGRVAPRLGEETFHRLYGPAEGARRWQAYGAAAEQGRATAAIRGRDAAGIAAAEAAWTGDPAAFQAARAADAAARETDPLGYALATQEGLEQALAEAGTPAERARIACAAQAEQGAGTCRLWTAAEAAALADAWDTLPPGPEGRNARLDFFRQHLLPLDPPQRPDAIRQFVADGIADGTEPEIAALLADLEAGRNNLARRKALGLTATGVPRAAAGGDGEARPPAAAQAEEGRATPLRRAQNETLDTWLARLQDASHQEGLFQDWSEGELAALEQAMLEGLEHEAGGDPDALLMLLQDLRPDAWREAEAVTAEEQAALDALSAHNLAVRLERDGLFVGPDGRFYRRTAELALNAPASPAGLLGVVGDTLGQRIVDRYLAAGDLSGLQRDHPALWAEVSAGLLTGGKAVGRLRQGGGRGLAVLRHLRGGLAPKAKSLSPAESGEAPAPATPAPSRDPTGAPLPPPAGAPATDAMLAEPTPDGEAGPLPSYSQRSPVPLAYDDLRPEVQQGVDRVLREAGLGDVARSGGPERDRLVALGWDAGNESLRLHEFWNAVHLEQELRLEDPRVSLQRVAEGEPGDWLSLDPVTGRRIVYDGMAGFGLHSLEENKLLRAFKGHLRRGGIHYVVVDLIGLDARQTRFVIGAADRAKEEVVDEFAKMGRGLSVSILYLGGKP